MRWRRPRRWTPDTGPVVGYWDDYNVSHCFRGDRAFLAWLRANGLDPGDVQSLSVLDVKRGPIRVVEMVRDGRGPPVIDYEQNRAATRAREVPLVEPIPARFLRDRPSGRRIA